MGRKAKDRVRSLVQSKRDSKLHAVIKNGGVIESLLPKPRPLASSIPKCIINPLDSFEDVRMKKQQEIKLLQKPRYVKKERKEEPKEEREEKEQEEKQENQEEHKQIQPEEKNSELPPLAIDNIWQIVQDMNKKKKKKKSSNSKKRRQEHAKKLQEKLAMRSVLYESLEETKIPQEHVNLLQSSATLGQKQTLKQRLKRVIAEQKAGIHITDDDKLFKRVKQTKNDTQKDDENEIEDDEDDEDEEEEEEDEEDDDNDDDKTTTTTTTTTDIKPISAAKEEKRRLQQLEDEKERELFKESQQQQQLLSTTTTTTTTITTTMKQQPAVYVSVRRTAEIEASRSLLPIIGEEQVIMEAITHNDAVIICGETGSGKTTQVPQFLYEAGYGGGSGGSGKERSGIVGISQPRRVAAIAMARRVAEELNVPFGVTVGYRIRHDSQVMSSTPLQFMTDGVLLREISSDFLLSRYSVIVLDEAHERNLNTDVLIGLLSRIIPLRAQVGPARGLSPLKLIIMSATLRVTDFTENKTVFPLRPPPVIHIKGRQHPVTIHFNRTTPLTNYVAAAFSKVSAIHRKLPPGGILVFLTGQQEIDALCRKLAHRFPAHTASSLTSKSSTTTTTTTTTTITTTGTLHAESDFGKIIDNEEDEEKRKELEYKQLTALPDDDDVHNDDDDDDDDDDRHGYVDMDAKEEKKNNKKGETESLSEFEQMEVSADVSVAPLHVVPLYSLLSADKQLLVFQPPPPGHRLCVVATNVAETSITIPNITYVVDCGKSKERVYSRHGMSSFEVGWISKASADQRAGRAGRMGPGHCYRLFSSAVFNDFFPLFSQPEILRLPIDGVVLQMKNMGIQSVLDFPFPTPPQRDDVKDCLKKLVILGALDGSKPTNQITDVGRSMCAFPVSPRYAKMIILGEQGGCLPYVCAMAAMLAVGDPFLHSSTDRGIMPHFRHNHSDILSALTAVGAYSNAKDPSAFCKKYRLHEKSMQEIKNLRLQLANIILEVSTSSSENENEQQQQQQMQQTALPLLTPPTKEQEVLLRQIILAGLVDHVAKFIDFNADAGGRAEYQSCMSNTPLFIHPNSVLATAKPPPSYVVYHEVITTSFAYMRGVTQIDPVWLSALAPALCTFGKPLEYPPPKYSDAKDTIMTMCPVNFGIHSWTLPPSKTCMSHTTSTENLTHAKFFAKFLLEGKIFSHIQAFPLASSPDLLIKGWATSKTTSIINTLANNRITSKKALLAAWQRNPKFLLPELLAWIQPTHHTNFISSYPFDK